MALFDFLKRKKESAAAKAKADKVEKAKKQPAKKAEKISAVKETEKKETVKTGKTKGFSYHVIQEPHVSEKATNLAEQNKYTFKVYEASNKPEIKKAVEGIYGVDVLGVKIIKIPQKKRRIGRTEGFKKGHTKAIVTIKEGQKIEIL